MFYSVCQVILFKIILNLKLKKIVRIAVLTTASTVNTQYLKSNLLMYENIVFSNE